MRFTAVMKHQDPLCTYTWTEKYHVYTTNPIKWLQRTIADYNASLAPCELALKLVKVVVEDNNARLDHLWCKANQVPTADGIDHFWCAACGASGTRQRGRKYITTSAPDCKESKSVQCRNANPVRYTKIIRRVR